MIALYHGSRCIIEKPQYGLGRPGNDYGKAFYCTLDMEMAKEWACSFQQDGYSNEYEFDDSGLDVFDFECGKYHILNWLAVLLDNRNIRLRLDIAGTAKEYILEKFLPDYKYADIIRGYRADDSFFGFANDFLNNSISLATLSELMKLGELGKQYALYSRAAFERISHVRSILARSDIYYSKYKKRDNEARRKAMLMRRPEPAGIYILDIMRGGWSNDDVRLQRFIC